MHTCSFVYVWARVPSTLVLFHCIINKYDENYMHAHNIGYQAVISMRLDMSQICYVWLCVIHAGIHVEDNVRHC